jgi:hypothetical protein
MNTDENLTAEVKKPTGASNRLKNVIGSIAVLAVVLLAGLVVRSYEAGIPPADLAPTSPATQYIQVSISEQNLTNGMQSVPGHAQPAAPAQPMPPMKRPA